MLQSDNSFPLLSAYATRTPQKKVEVDWDMDGTFTDESEYVSVVEVERKINEPLGGIALAQGDVVFINKNARFSP